MIIIGGKQQWEKVMMDQYTFPCFSPPCPNQPSTIYKLFTSDFQRDIYLADICCASRETRIDSVSFCVNMGNMSIGEASREFQITV